MKSGEDGKEEKKEGARISLDVAEQEVIRWLDLKRISEHKRKELFEGNINTLAELVSYGILRFDFEAKKAVYKLQVALKTNQGEITTLDLRFYLGIKQASNFLNNVDAGDMDGRTIAIISALSGKAPSILTNATNEFGEQGMDMTDLATLKHYALFFLG